MNNVKKPCINCIYFNACGNTNRKEQCNGRQTKQGESRDIKQEISTAVENLGLSFSKIEIATASYHRLIVWADDIRIGIYDMDRHTFID